MCACAGVELTPIRRARIARARDSGLDWPEFLRQAEHHGVLALAARSLGEQDAGVPAPIAEALRSAFDINLRRSLWFTGELARILEHFERHGLRVVPYKGPLLAETVYGDVALRNFSDLDFLIAPADFARAREGLREIGYQPSSPLAPAIERYWLRHGYECSFDGAAGRHLVELQWRMLPRFYAVDLRTEDLLSRAGRASLGGREVRALAPEDGLLALCLHAAKHLWMRLIWVCDIAETVRVVAIDWAEFRRRAQSLGVSRIAAVSFRLAETLLGAELPDAARALAAGHREASTLAGTFAARLARGAAYDFNSTEYFRLAGKLRERSLDRARYFWRLTFTPGQGDLAAVRLPESLFPLYRGVRIARLLRRLL